MTHRLIFHPKADDEFAEVQEFYRECDRPGLVSAFIDDVERVLDLIAVRPEAGRKVAAHIRAWKLRRFPYSVVYRVVDDAIRVLAIAHHRRRPGYWRQR